MLTLALMLLADTGVAPWRVDRIWRENDRAWGRHTKAASYAFFEFAPLSGAGMGTACACTTPTGAKGEALTFTRASSGTCTKANTTSSIANGDVVVCSTNQPRVMPGGDGTGALGLLVESARTNSLVRSQEIDNASWTKAGAAGVPVVTADAATAPDATATAERVQFAACPTAATTSEVSQAGSAGVNSTTVYLKGNGGSGSLSLCLYNTGAACAVCTFNPTTWTRCERPANGSGSTLAMGCINNTAVYPGSSNTGAADVFVWGVQMETGTYATSYIPTVGAAATRAADAATLPVVINTATSGISYAATGIVPGPNYFLEYIGDANNRPTVALSSSTLGQCQYISTGGNSTVTTTVPSAFGVPTRVACSWTSAPLTSIFAGGNTNTSATATSAFTTSSIFVGGSAFFGSVRADGVVKQVCLDPSPTRCR